MPFCSITGLVSIWQVFDVLGKRSFFKIKNRNWVRKYCLIGNRTVFILIKIFDPRSNKDLAKWSDQSHEKICKLSSKTKWYPWGLFGGSSIIPPPFCKWNFDWLNMIYECEHQTRNIKGLNTLIMSIITRLKHHDYALPPSPSHLCPAR